MIFFFLFRFHSEVDVPRVITAGPWSFRGQFLHVFPWRPDFNPMTEMPRSSPVWIQLPDLPLEYWNRECLSGITKALGRPIKIDDRSLKLERGHSVRICVEIDLSSPLHQRVWIGAA